MTRRARERGSFAPLVAYGTVVVCVMGIGGATLGRIVDARREAQNVADAAALSAADTMRENGVDANRSAALRLARLNSRAPTNANITAVDNLPRELDITAGAVQSVDTPRFIFDGDAQVKTHARAKIDQEVRTIPGANTADLAFVLDFSGSMNDAIPGGTKITTLKNALTQYLNDRRIQLDYAAALFAGAADHGLVGSVPFGADSIQKIIQLFQQFGADGGTSPELGFDKVTEFFGPRNQSGPPRFVAFVSDGQPNDDALARAGSQRMWTKAGPTVMTLHIGSPEAKPFMVDVSGPPPQDCKLPPDQCPNKADYYYPVDDIDAFKKALAQILGRVACPLEPLDRTRLKDPNTVNAFLRDRGGHEIKLPPVGSSGGDGLGFFFNPNSFDIAVTIDACVLMRNEGRRLVIRYNRAVLVE